LICFHSFVYGRIFFAILLRVLKKFCLFNFCGRRGSGFLLSYHVDLGVVAVPWRGVAIGSSVALNDATDARMCVFPENSFFSVDSKLILLLWEMRGNSQKLFPNQPDNFLCIGLIGKMEAKNFCSMGGIGGVKFLYNNIFQALDQLFRCSPHLA
jgi:hypothetical protein